MNKTSHGQAHIIHLHLYELAQLDNSIETESSLVTADSWGGGEDEK